MADAKVDKGRKQLEEEVWSAIGAFEQILEAMPEDRASLETLSHAYGQIGDVAKSYEYLVRLGRVLVNENDVAAASDLLERLRDKVGDDKAGRELVAEIEAMSATPRIESSSPQATPYAFSTTRNISEDLAFTWNLLQAGELTQEEYASVVQDLTEMSGSETTVTVSVLHALEARGFKGLDRAIIFAAQDCGTPFISLDSIDIPQEAGTLLPLEFVVRRGALVFDFLGSHALAIVMNPYDKELRREIEVLADRPCDFFITHASEFDRALERLTNIEVESVSERS